MQALIQFFGRLHPMVLHAPIGLLTGLAVIETVAMVGRRPLPSSVRSTLTWLIALSAVFTAAAGLVLSLEDSYTADAVQWHQWLGIGVAAACLIAGILQQAGYIAAFRVVLLIALGLVIPAGHLGASLTHGAGFLTEPFSAHNKPVPQDPAASAETPGQPALASTYSKVIAPIFNSRCANCHGTTRHKGSLVLITPDGIRKGGKHGPVLVAGDSGASEILIRLTLPLDDVDHMPPEGKPQPTESEIQAIKDWVIAGAPFDAASAEPPSPELPPPAPKPPEGPRPADPAAIKALRDALVHVEPVQQGSNLLVIDFAAVASRLSEPEMLALLEPLREQIAELAVARSKAGDTLLALAAKMPELTRLNLTGTAISDAGLEALAGHKKLQDLVLTQTHLTTAAAKSLAELPALKRLYTWKSGLDPESLTVLKDRGVTVDTGEVLIAHADETEKEIKLTGNAPPPPSPPSGDALKPVNTICPVSGKPVDPRYLIVYKGRVIGLCCNHCPTDFWADPEKYEANIH